MGLIFKDDSSSKYLIEVLTTYEEVPNIENDIF